MSVDSELLRKQLEDLGLYNVLIHLHEHEHTAYCFCTTEISGPYRKLLDIIAQSTQLAGLEARIDELKNLTFNNTRTYKQTVTDREGNMYIDESHSYISVYETRERLTELQQALDTLKKESEL